MNEQIKIAQTIATVAHFGQFRRDGKTPYIEHPRAVAESLRDESPEVQATAWLHDVIEDTKVRASDLLFVDGLPNEVIEAVMILTKYDGVTYDDYLAQLSQNEIARKVKIADMLHNLSDSPSEKQVAKYTLGLKILGYKTPTP